MFWKRKDSTVQKDDPGARELLGLIKDHLPDADDATVSIVTAVAGLLAGTKLTSAVIPICNVGKYLTRLCPLLGHYAYRALCLPPDKK